MAVFARRDIEPGEELCFSYSGDIDEDGEDMDDVSDDAMDEKSDAVYAKCYCGAKNCKGSFCLVRASLSNTSHKVAYSASINILHTYALCSNTQFSIGIPTFSIDYPMFDTIPNRRLLLSRHGHLEDYYFRYHLLLVFVYYFLALLRIQRDHFQDHPLYSSSFYLEPHYLVLGW